VGRAGKRRRKPSRHPPKVESRVQSRSFSESPYSYEGALEAMGEFAHGTRGMSASQARIVRRLFALMVAVIVLLFVAQWAIGRVVG
jgi:hypothetical protein